MTKILMDDSMEREEKTSLLDNLLNQTGKFLPDLAEQASNSQPMPASGSSTSTCSLTAVKEELDGSKVHRMMFKEGKNRIQVKRFEFPGRADMKLTEAFSEALDLDTLVGNPAKEKLAPHATRMQNAQKILMRSSNLTETLTQAVFYFVLGELLLSFCPDHIVEDVTQMTVAKTRIEVCGEYFDAQHNRKHGTNVKGSKAKSTTLKLQSDLVVINAKTVKQAAEENIKDFRLRALLDGNVNIEMKKFKSLKGDKNAAKAQVSVESMMRACHGKGNGTLLLSLLCDCAGLCVLVHEVHANETTNDVRRDDVYYISRWESQVDRMVSIIVWIVKLSQRENMRFNGIFKGGAVCVETEPDENWNSASPQKKRKTSKRGSGAGSNECETIVEEKEKGEEPRNREMQILESCSDSSLSVDLKEEDEEDEEPSRVLLHALSQTLFGTDVPLSKEVLSVLGRDDTERREFCFATGQWQSSGIDNGAC